MLLHASSVSASSAGTGAYRIRQYKETGTLIHGTAIVFVRKNHQIVAVPSKNPGILSVRNQSVVNQSTH